MLHSTVLVTWLMLVQSMPTYSPPHWGDHVKALSNATTNEGRFEALTAILKQHGIAFTVEPFTIDRPRGGEPRTAGRNVVVTIGNGTDDLVIGAHYDAVRLPDGSLSHGAVDNAASCEVLVELAYQVAQSYERSRPVRIKIVWFDMEELGLLGSAAYVRAHSGDRIRAMLNFDVNAYGDTVLFGPPAGGESDQMRRRMVETCAAQPIDCIRLAPMPPGDDRPFGQARIPTLSIAILPAAEAHQLWLTMSVPGRAGQPANTPAVLTTIHTANDVAAKVDGTTIARMYTFTWALVQALTNSLN
jgi:hypothetical protein